MSEISRDFSQIKKPLRECQQHGTGVGVEGDRGGGNHIYNIYIYIYVAVDPLNRAFGLVASPELVGGLSARGLDLILTSMLVKHL